MEASEIYARIPLEVSTKQIRLVELLPGNIDEVIQCRFHSISLLDRPEYAALSYSWGPPKPYKNILLNDTEFPIRRNLWWFLHHARTRNETQLFWIDALCIDQSNDSERSHQVGLMGKIYITAASVTVWLGEADKKAESDLAMDFVDRKGLAPLRTKAGRFQSLWSPSEGQALLSLCERNYWKRVWVVQEIMHGEDLTVLCGSKSFPWQNILQIFLNLKTIAEIGHAVHLHSSAAIFNSPASVLVKAKSAWHGQRIPLWDLLETYRDLQSTPTKA